MGRLAGLSMPLAELLSTRTTGRCTTMAAHERRATGDVQRVLLLLRRGFGSRTCLRRLSPTLPRCMLPCWHARPRTASASHGAFRCRGTFSLACLHGGWEGVGGILSCAAAYSYVIGE